VKYGRNTLLGVRVVDTPTSDFLGVNNDCKDSSRADRFDL